MAKLGIKEVLNVVFIDKKTNKPALYFDTLKVSSVEMTSESQAVTGGQGNSTLMEFAYGRAATMTITDALISMNSLAALAGTEVSTGAQTIYEREIVTGVTNKIELKETPKANSFTVFQLADGEMGEEVTGITSGSGKSLTVGTPFETAVDVVVYYEYEVEASKAQSVTFSGDKFPSAYKVVGWGLAKNQQTGAMEKVQLVIGTAQLKTDHTITFDAENVSTFDFNLSITATGEDKKLYEIIRY